MLEYNKNVFIGQRIQLDGHRFIGNTFKNCVLVYGGGPLHMSDNNLDNVKWEFVDAAARTLALLSSFYQQEGDSRKFVELLMATFAKPTAPPSGVPQP